MRIQEIYERRFEADVQFREIMWQVLCKHFFQQYVSEQDIVLEIGAGYCEFINNICSDKKIAVDINPDTKKYASNDVEVILCQANKMDIVDSDSIDVIFVSNVFEHLERQTINETIQEIFRILRPGGKVITLHPNIRFAYRDYWMFFDHITPIDDRALVEVLETNNFELVEIIVKFLPFTTKSILPKSAFFIRLYLVLKIIWPIFGKQSLLIAEKPIG